VKFNAKQLRASLPGEGDKKKIIRRPLWIVSDNVMDTYNIGGLFRLADAVGAKELILCNGSETPPSSRIHKSAVGTENWVSWRYFGTALEALLNLKVQFPNIKIVVIEQNKKAIGLFQLQYRVPEDQPLVVVVGHETEGVSEEALNLADIVVEIPMWGINKSLNVIVSCAIVLYRLME
jgi:tRNA G18 (ribose-2'-O)-methylase SpoU